MRDGTKRFLLRLSLVPISVGCLYGAALFLIDLMKAGF